ncbi:MAG: hypothetical protein KF864_02840 [Phycisphaeraceae bacterium]|nr:hypothetical protein [Phycisphaeraceae bacterium]
MASCKSGTPVPIVAPAEPAEAHDADTADPGEVSELKLQQRKEKKGKYGKEEVKPFKAEETDDKEKTWIEILLKDPETGEPIPGEAYAVKMPDGSLKEGTLDGKGFARVDDVDPGNCEVTFPKLDESRWDKKN